MSKGKESVFPSMASNSHSLDEIPHHFDPVNGLTKRELFAAMAMQGLASCSLYNSTPKECLVALLAVKHADALLAELEKDSEVKL